MFRSHSERTKRKQKQKQKQSTIPMSFSGDSSGTKNSSTHTLPVQTSTDSIPSVVTPESKPEAPVLSDPELSPARPSLGDTKLVNPNLNKSGHDSLPSRSYPAQPTAAPPKPPSFTSVNSLSLPSAPAKPPSVSAPASESIPVRPISDNSPKTASPLSSKTQADNSTPLTSIPSESLPVGGRRGKSSDDDTNGAATRGGELVHGREGAISSAGLQMPGQLLNDPDEKGALKIKVHLNLHAKVRLDLDAQIYGDVVIGLL
ncbi:hypothetical protein VI817_010197 [Penicillium citrinum]|nr:hypothetical protein VI817_010197 [Penicillium citrinum]